MPNAKEDWRVALMAKLTEWTQDNDSHFVPIIHSWDANQPPSSLYPPLSHLLNSKIEDIPHIYLLHPISETVTPYPEKLEDATRFSPELIVAWANKVIIEWEIADYEGQLAAKYTDESGEEKDVFDE